MKYRLVVLLFVLLNLLYPTTLNAALDEFTVEQQGIIRYEFGHICVTGNEENYANALNLHAGYNHLYQLDLTGHIFNPEQDLSYTFRKYPAEKLDLQFIWNHPWFYTAYNKGINVSFPDLALSMSKNRIDGFYLKSAGDILSVFSGIETYIPMSKDIIVIEATCNKYQLYDTPSAGDVVEYSEVIILDGKMLERNKDYVINYLRGEVEFYTALEQNMMIQIRFLFILTNDELINVKGERLQGAVLSRKWGDNNISAYAVKRGTAINQVKGLSASIMEGPFAFKGEYAASESASGTSGEAYNLNCSYLDEIVQASYQVQAIDPAFQEIGVSSFVKGQSNLFELKYQADSNVQLLLNLNKYVMGEEEARRTNSSTTATTNLQFAANQEAQLIFAQNMQAQNEEVKREVDLSLGYAYSTRPLTIALGQSVQSPMNRFINIKLNKESLNIQGRYHVESLWEGKQHQVHLETDYQPVEQLSFNANLDYNQMLAEQKGNAWFAFNTHWQPNPNLSTTLAYIYFNNAKYESDSQRYSILNTYSTEGICSDLVATFLNLESVTNHTRDFELNWAFNRPLFTNYHLNYQLNQQSSSEFNKSSKEYNSQKNNQAHNLSLAYTWNNDYTFSGNIGLIRNKMYTGDWSDDTILNIGVDWTYQNYTEEERQLTFAINYSTRTDEQNYELNNTIIMPWKWLNVNHRMKLTIPAGKFKPAKALVDTKLVLGKLLGITPSISYLYEITGVRRAVENKEALTCTLQYDLTANCSLYLKGQLDRSSTNSYLGKGAFTGVEVKF